MDVERTMEFILEQQAKNQEMLANLLAAQDRAEQRMDRADRRMDRLAKFGVNLSRAGLKARNKLNGRVDRHDQLLDRIELNLAEATEKLNALIAVVNGWQRNPS